jgi:DNA modification methylase
MGPCSFHASIGDLAGKRNFRNTDLFFQSLEQPFGMIVCGDEIIGIDAVPGSCSDAHFAAFSPALVEPCIMAGCPAGGVVLDPFVGSGTTAIVAHKHDRTFIGIDLSKTYLDGIAIPRIKAATAQLKLFA